jgi:hypothetical protein
MATGDHRGASDSTVAEQDRTDEKRGNLTRRATLWNQFDALMRAQGPVTPDRNEKDSSNDGKENNDTNQNSAQEQSASKPESSDQGKGDGKASKEVKKAGYDATKGDGKPSKEVSQAGIDDKNGQGGSRSRGDQGKGDGKTSKEVSKTGHDATKGGSRTRCDSEGSDQKESSRTVKSGRLSRQNSNSSRITANESNHSKRKNMETTGIGELDRTQESNGIVRKNSDIAANSGQEASSQKTVDSSSGETSKKTRGGHHARRKTVGEERTSKGLRVAHNRDGKAHSKSDNESLIKHSGATGSVGDSKSRSTGDRHGEHDAILHGQSESPHSSTLLVSGSLNQSRPHSQESGHSQRTDNLEEPLTFSRPGSSGSEYYHRSDVNLSESLNRWVNHLTSEQKDSPRHSPRGMTPSISPLPGNIPSYGKPIMPGYKPTSTKQESLVLPRPARVAEPLHPNPSLRDCIPIMPRSAAIVCFIFNILVPGLGKFYSNLYLLHFFFFYINTLGRGLK